MLAKNKKTGEFFAMKRLKKADIIKLRQVDHVISENTILADIDHPYLVSQWLSVASNLLIVFRLCDSFTTYVLRWDLKGLVKIHDTSTF